MAAALTWICIGVIYQLLPVHSYHLKMITEGQRYVVARGESIILMCDFEAEQYNLFDYPVLWTKIQHHERYQINIMGNLNKPFVAEERFQVSFSKQDPKHRLELFISDVVPEDSGNYSCEIRGPSSVAITSVTHYVYIKTPVDSVVIQANNYSSGAVNEEHPKHSRRITMIEDTMNAVRCTAHGGYPAPALEMKLGKKDITKHFNKKSVHKLSGEPGLRIITYMTEVWTDSFVPSADNDGSRLKCIASVPGLSNNVTAMKLDIHYAPKVKCHSLSVFVSERNAALRCEIYHKPDITNLYWIIDVNGTTVSQGEHINGFWILMSESEDNYMESQLIMGIAKPENFRVYTIVVENSVSATKRNVELLQKERTTTARPLLDDPNSASQLDQTKFGGFVSFRGRNGCGRLLPSGSVRMFTVWALGTILMSLR